ncbi:MAG: response regulator [Desulfobacterales bacterium]|nr:response regulator [Desulfobacterales bacterium]
MGYKLLLVDDEEGIRKVLGITLTDMGYDVFTAEDGDKALQIFQKENPQIVLTDIKMPGMDGIELLQKIKLENPDSEVIMITGHGDMDLAIKSLKYQAVDFVTKPINDEVLEIALNRAREKILMRQQLQEYTENLEELVREKSAQVVALERQVAVDQTIQGLSAAMRNIAGDLEGGLNYFNEMPCFVSIHDSDLKLVAANQLYCDRLGDKTGANSWEVYTGENGKPDQCPSAQTFKTGTGQRTKATVKYTDGTQTPVIVHTAPIRNQAGEVDLVVEIAADMGEVNRLQEELRHTQQRYQQLFDEVPCYISVQDRQFRLTAANRRFTEDFDVSAGSHCYEIYKHRGHHCPNCPVIKTFEDEKSHQSEMVVTAKSGERYNVLIWTAPLRNAAGEVTHVMEMSTNITQVRQLQDRLSSLGLKISSISHGIKSMLTGLDGGLYLVDSGLEKDDPDRVRDGWDAVKTMVSRIRSLVQNILFVAKERELGREQIRVVDFLSDVASGLETKIKNQGVAFECSFDPSMGTFEIDAGVMRIALQNILENALDACLEDKTPKTHKIEFKAEHNDHLIQIEIGDNGVGMDQDTLGDIFKLFFSTKDNKGTGLGLYITKTIIEQHGGKIAVSSRPEVETRFKISLPKQFPTPA